MSITKEYLSKIKEIPLQNEILVPLFRSMGFKDVTLYQGPDELGKDIVMWKEEILGERLNYGVVVKAKKVDGRAAGNSSAANVRFQIEQAFENPYPDPITTQERIIDRCFVVSSKQITNNAIKAIRGSLKNSNLDKVTRFIGGEALWELIEQYLGDRTILGKLAEIKQRGDRVDPHYRMVPVLRENGILLTIQPKDPKALKDYPLRFSP